MFERLASVDGVFAAGMAVAAGSPLPVCCGVVWCGVVWCGVVWCVVLLLLLEGIQDQNYCLSAS